MKLVDPVTGSSVEAEGVEAVRLLRAGWQAPPKPVKATKPKPKAEPAPESVPREE